MLALLGLHCAVLLFLLYTPLLLFHCELLTGVWLWPTTYHHWVSEGFLIGDKTQKIFSNNFFENQVNKSTGILKMISRSSRLAGQGCEMAQLSKQILLYYHDCAHIHSSTKSLGRSYWRGFTCALCSRLPLRDCLDAGVFVVWIIGSTIWKTETSTQWCGAQNCLVTSSSFVMLPNSVHAISTY